MSLYINIVIQIYINETFQKIHDLNDVANTCMNQKNHLLLQIEVME